MNREIVTDESVILNPDKHLTDELLNQFEKEMKLEFFHPEKKKALLLFMMDTSGSMGSWEKYIARSFYTWIKHVFLNHYDRLTVQFIAHHTEARLVTTEEEFFQRGEQGGTIASSCFRKAKETLALYDVSKYDIYLIHATDGDNLTMDCERYFNLLKELMPNIKQFFYFEPNQYGRHSTIRYTAGHTGFSFPQYVVNRKVDVYDALRVFFHPLIGSENTNIYHARSLTKEW